MPEEEEAALVVPKEERQRAEWVGQRKHAGRDWEEAGRKWEEER